MNASSNIVPPTRAAAIAWFLAHGQTWAGAPAAIGLDVDLANAVISRAAAAATADREATAARSEADAKAKLARSTRAAMDRDGGRAIKVIRAFAEASADPAEVYAAAEIPGRKAPTPRPGPAAPTDVNATLLSTGGLEVRWKASTRGTNFRVQRRLTTSEGSTGGWIELQFDGVRPFTDYTVPAGTVEVGYRVRGIRAGKTSPWSDSANVLFVANAQVNRPAMKIAA